ncbi:hypothetical protein LCGC14_2144400 [marine sediment metagenome]|uniref:Uncharacterized protein n=1 Tax=marine sediment metagenome TaxID=412755 RepID=A0A0F9DXF3_9ZZZZ
MTHTLGPWKLAPDPYRAAPQIIANGRRIAKVFYEGGSEDREVDYNARLIAAAPELLITAEEMLRALQTHTVLGRGDYFNAVERQMKQAIAKAT